MILLRKREMLGVNREYLYKLVDAVPNNKLKEVEKILKIMAMPEEVPTKEELEAIRIGEEQIRNGEFLDYTQEEFKKEMIDIPPKAKQTATKEDIQKIFEKAVRTHGKTLERLSKN